MTINITKQRILSGIQPSGKPTIGNLIGAFIPQVSMQNDYTASFFIADLHAITVRQAPQDLHDNSYEMAAWYLASGLDVTSGNANLFIQSHVRAHTELGWIMSTFTQMGELERMTQFKEKAAKHKHNINAGLFGYPVLMAADVFLHDTDIVPFGDDQRQHLELARDIATRFNGVHGDILTIPKAVLPKVGARIKDLQTPTKKMSKSDAGKGSVFLLDDMKTIEKKIKRAETDSLGKVNFDVEKQAGISNLLTIYSAVTGTSIEDAVKEFSDSQYGTFKQAVADSVIAKVEPIQGRFHELMKDKGELDNILAQGAERANITAEATLLRVKKAMGFVTL